MVFSCVFETSNLVVMLRPTEAANPPDIVLFIVQYLHCELCSHFPQPGYTRNCACPHCTSTSPSGFMCKTPLPRKDHFLQSWCPYNPLPPDAALAGPNLCSNPSRATKWFRITYWFCESSKKKLRFFPNNLQTTMQDYHGTKWVPATLPYGKAEIYRNVCLSYSICNAIV